MSTTERGLLKLDKPILAFLIQVMQKGQLKKNLIMEHKSTLLKIGTYYIALIYDIKVKSSPHHSFSFFLIVMKRIFYVRLFYSGF